MEKIWGYVVGATIFGSVTGFIVLIIKNLLKNKINKRYAYLFWMILVIKLIIPFGPESNISLFNKIHINYNNLDDVFCPGCLNDMSERLNFLEMPSL